MAFSHLAASSILFEEWDSKKAKWEKAMNPAKIEDAAKHLHRSSNDQLSLLCQRVLQAHTTISVRNNQGPLANMRRGGGTPLESSVYLVYGANLAESAAWVVSLKESPYGPNLNCGIWPRGAYEMLCVERG